MIQSKRILTDPSGHLAMPPDCAPESLDYRSGLYYESGAKGREPARGVGY